MQTRRRTRSIQQQNERVASTPVKGERPQRLLQSPSRIDEYYAPRKTPRTVPEKSFKDVIRAVRKTGGQQSRSGHQASLQLTGLLASLPREVSNRLGGVCCSFIPTRSKDERAHKSVGWVWKWCRDGMTVLWMYENNFRKYRYPYCWGDGIDPLLVFFFN